MQVNLNCGCPKSQFGMAFRRPEGKDLSKLSDYLGLSEEINRKGFAQYIKELKNHKQIDLEKLIKPLEDFNNFEDVNLKTGSIY